MSFITLTPVLQVLRQEDQATLQLHPESPQVRPRDDHRTVSGNIVIELLFASNGMLR